MTYVSWLHRFVQPVAILLPLMAWLAALDDFRNWLIREAALNRRLLSFLGEPAVPDWIDRASRE